MKLRLRTDHYHTTTRTTLYSALHAIISFGTDFEGIVHLPLGTRQNNKYTPYYKIIQTFGPELGQLTKDSLKLDIPKDVLKCGIHSELAIIHKKSRRIRR